MNTQPEALGFANGRPISLGFDLYQWAKDAEELIRTQHADIERKDALLRRLIDALDLDRHDVDDWPTDSREALYAIKQELAK